MSIADSLVRLTGLTTQRTNGRSQQIAIRGLTGDYSIGTLDGFQQVTTNDNRAVEFDQYPAELLSGVVVYKTAEADMVGGLAGTIDLQTVQPLSRKGRHVAMNAWYEWTQYKKLTPGLKTLGDRFTLSYVDQFDDDKAGIAIGFASTNTPYEGEQFQAWGYPQDSAGNYVMGGTKSYSRTSTLDRNALMAAFEFKPTPGIHSTVDAYYTHFKEDQLLRGMEIPLAFWSSAHLQPGYTASGGLITSMTLTNVQPVVRNDTFIRTDDLSAVNWTLEMGKTSAWPIKFGAGYSTDKRKDENLETYSGLGFAAGATDPDTMRITEAPGQIPHITPTYDYTNTSLFTLTDPQGWGTGTLPTTGMEGYLKYFQEKDALGELKLSTTHEMDWNFVKDLEIGMDYTDRYKRAGENPTGFIVNANGKPSAPLPPIIGTTDMSWLGIGKVFAYDPVAALSNGYYTFIQHPYYNTFIGRNFKIWEKLYQPYAQLDLQSNIGSMPIFGNVGVMAVTADQSSSGVSGSGGNIASHVSGGVNYTDWLPSANLVLKPTASTFVRLAASRQEARPRMYDMRASREYNYDATLVNSTDLSRSPWSGDSGNPMLRPWRANSFDVSLEHYFSDSHGTNEGFVSLAAFDKKLLTYIYQQNALTDFTGYPTQGTTPKLWQGIATTPENGQGGSLNGLELTVSLSSELLTHNAVRGFGIYTGGAITDSKIQPWGPGNGTSPIAGLSKKTGNLTIYYERYGFSARVSETYRSATREYITTFGPPNPAGDENPGSGFTLALPERIVDAQVSYTIEKGPLADLTFYVQGYNLNDEPLVTYNNGDPRQVMNYQKYGASYSVGASYKF